MVFGGWSITIVVLFRIAATFYARSMLFYLPANPIKGRSTGQQKHKRHSQRLSPNSTPRPRSAILYLMLSLLCLLTRVRQVVEWCCNRSTVMHGNHWHSFLKPFRKPSAVICADRELLDRELLAIYLAIRHFRCFVDSHQFIVYTDHAPMCHALFTRSRHSSSPQLRHLDFISQFTSDERYIKEEHKLVSDCLSRAVGAIFGGQPATDFLAMAVPQTHDSSHTGFQTGDHSLQLEHRPISEYGVSLLGDVSQGSFRPLVPEGFRKQVLRHYIPFPILVSNTVEN